MIAPSAKSSCPANYRLLNFKVGDRYDASITPVRVCVPGIGSNPGSGLYTTAFCWNFQCPVFASLPKTGDVRAYIDQMPVAPAMPGGLAGKAVVMTHLEPLCAATTTTATVNGGGNYKFVKEQTLVVAIPSTGLATLDIDTRIQRGASACDDQWVVVALAEVPTAASTTPAVPPASCPCWERATANGTCSGIKIPITLTTLDTDTPMVVQQCIDPANFDPYTGRMAYSFCWRYACLPDDFASSRFSAVVTDLDRWNIGKMSAGDYSLLMQRSEGIYMTVSWASTTNWATSIPHWPHFRPMVLHDKRAA
jgi:hypothetical protein